MKTGYLIIFGRKIWYENFATSSTGNNDCKMMRWNEDRYILRRYILPRYILLRYIQEDILPLPFSSSSPSAFCSRRSRRSRCDPCFPLDDETRRIRDLRHLLLNCILF